jgi:hypothetical protein
MCGHWCAGGDVQILVCGCWCRVLVCRQQYAGIGVQASVQGVGVQVAICRH